MANSSQSIKRARQNNKRRLHNQMQRSAYRTAIKKLLVMIESAALKKEAAEFFREVTSTLDKAVRKNIIHKNKAARLKSRLNAKLKAAADRA